MAILFDGTTSLFTLASPTALDDVFASPGGTVMAWINPASVGENGFGRVFDKGNVWLLHMNNTDVANSLSFNHSFSSTDGFWDFPASTISAFNTWYHIAVVFAGTTSAPLFYVNGALVTTTTRSTPVGTKSSDAAGVLRIGQIHNASTRTFDGQITGARMYNRLLTANEILTIYTTRGNDGIISGVAGRWAMKELSDGTAASATGIMDFSANNNDSTAVTALTYKKDFINLRKRVQ